MIPSRYEQIFVISHKVEIQSLLKYDLDATIYKVKEGKVFEL